MTGPRALRERKKVINYNEDIEEPRTRRGKDVEETEKRITRSRDVRGAVDKENRKRKERTAARKSPSPEEDVESSDNDDAPNAARPAKRAKSPPRRSGNDDDDAIEGSDDDANAFIAFARPGKAPAAARPGRPAAKPKAQASKPAAPPARTAAPNGRRGAGATAARKNNTVGDEDNAVASRRPARAAASRANARLRKSAAADAGGKGRGKGRGSGSDSMEVDESEDEEEEEQDSGSGSSSEDEDGGDAGTKKVAGQSSGSQSESEEEDESEEEEDVPAKPVTRGAGRAPASGRGRTQPARRVAPAAKGGANSKRSRGRGSSSDDEQDDEQDDKESSSGSSSESESEDEEEEAGAAGAANGNGSDGDDSDVEIVDVDADGGSGGAADAADGSEDGSSSGSESDSDSENSDDDDDSEEDAEDAEPKRGRGRPRKDAGKARPVPQRSQPGRKGKGQAKAKAKEAAAAKASGGRKAAGQAGDKAKAKAKAKAGENKGAAKGKPTAEARGGGDKGGDKGGKGSAKGPREAVERILSYDPATELYHVKLEGVSYRRTEHVSQAYLERVKPGLLRSFAARELHIDVDQEWKQVERVIAVRTVSRGVKGAAKQLLVKWRGLEYGDCTWEWEADLESEEDKAAIKRFHRYTARAKTRASRGAAKKGKASDSSDSEGDDSEDESSDDEDGGNDGSGADAMEVDGGAAGAAPGAPAVTGRRALRRPDFPLPTFCSGRSLRDYQQVSVRWMVNNYVQRRNCILGDEMGLGKTAQSISCLETLRSVGGVPGPFLIVAPLTTLGHWQREVQTWTDMNVVLFAGSAADRAVILEHEFYVSKAGNGGSAGGRSRPRSGGDVRFDVLLASYDTLLKERSLLRSIPWCAAVFDEAHRLKGLTSATRAAVQELDIDWLLLLTGTPIQNNMMELYAILNLLDPDAYPSAEGFAARFGGGPGGQPPSVEQIKELQAVLAPILLRRMKEDVEALPQKEEVVIWVELTAHQRSYYRALYEGQIGALLGAGPGGGGGGGRNLPAMRNLAMELRKLCCHPVLCDGLEDDLKNKLAAQREAAAEAAGPSSGPESFSCAEMELLVRGSGKMVLLHKLLPKLRAEGRRVLIFSQFVIMLNVLEDYCRVAGYPVERIDGSVTGRERQQAIDRFSAGDDSSAFVFLLSTRAGGQGITLTSADTCIIYDSDWNPQNDLQAMARCHRIGQKKDVTVYRLISADTYEKALFASASRKYGLDEAILGFSAGSDPEADSARIAALLRHGAHGLLGDEAEGAKKGEAFAGEDINQILEGRTEKRQIGSRAGNTFSVATFAIDDSGAADGDDAGADGLGRRAGGAGKRRGGRRRDEEAEEEKEYWRNLMPDAVAAHEAKAAEGPVVLGPRKRNKVNYNVEDRRLDPKESDDSEEETEAGGEEGAAGEGGAAGGKKRRRRRRGKRDGSEPAEGEEAGGGGAGGEEGAAGDGAAGKAKAKGRGRAPNPAWKRTEVKALEDRLVGMGPDRWEELYAQLQPFKRSLEEVEAAGRAVWELYGTAGALATERKKKAEAERQAAVREAVARLRAAEAAAEAEAVWGQAATGEAKVEAPPATAAAPQAPPAAATDAPAAGGAVTAAATAPAAPAQPDEYEQKLAEALEKLPESLRAALSGPTVVKRLLREAAENLRHGASMAELASLMRAKLLALRAEEGQQQAQKEKQGEGQDAKEEVKEKGEEKKEGDKEAAPGATSPSGTAAAAGGSALATLRAASVPIAPSAQLPGWWSRTDDEALLLATAQVGYTPGYPRRTVEFALRRPPLSSKVALQLDPADGAAAAAPEAMDAEGPGAQAQAAGAAAPAPKADGAATACGAAAGAPKAAAGGDQAMPEAAGQEAGGSGTAANGGSAAPAASTAGGPQMLTQEEWRLLVQALGRRLSRVVTATLDLHRRGVQPRHRASFGSRTGRPSGPPPLALAPTREASPGAALGGKPSGAAAAAGQPPAAGPSNAANATPAGAGTAAAAAPPAHRPSPPGNNVGANDAARPDTTAVVQPAGSGATAAPSCQQGTAAAKPNDAKPTTAEAGSGSGGKSSKPAAPSTTPATGGSGVKHALKQSTLPFARLSKPSSKASKAAAPTLAVAASGAVAADGQRLSPDGVQDKAAGAKLAAARGVVALESVPGVSRPVPGSAEGPINVD